jgi:hypothetical protein
MRKKVEIWQEKKKKKRVTRTARGRSCSFPLFHTTTKEVTQVSGAKLIFGCAV